ncbi:hypothetical protein VF12_35590, partial [Nostoc linckia z15]
MFLKCQLNFTQISINLARLTIILLINTLHRVEAKNNLDINVKKYFNYSVLTTNIKIINDTKHSAENKLRNTIFTQIPANLLPTPNPSSPELIHPFQIPASIPEENST